MRQPDPPGGGGAPQRRQSGAQPPVFNAPGVVLFLIAAIAAASVALWLLPAGVRDRAEILVSLIPRQLWASGDDPLAFALAAAPIVTHALFHWDLLHLLMNSVWLLALGAPVARRFGAGEAAAGPGAGVFLAFFFASAAAGGLLEAVAEPNAYSRLLGASGGVNGLLGAVIRFAFVGDKLIAAPLTDRRVLVASAVIIALNLYFGLFGGGVFGGGGGAEIGWKAHLGGYLFGLCAYPFFARRARAN
ncbi:MAG: rhomboid family intramembrane serine protease [Pseudomonadota bacterium]